MNKTSVIFKYVLGLAATAIACTAHGQQLEEVVVTATHRAENLQEIPVTVSAIGAEDPGKG